MDQKKLLFLFNPHAGRGMIQLRLTEVLDIFVKAGYEVTVYPTQERGDATQKIPLMAGRFDRLVCCGGDGTLNEVVAGMLQSEVRIPVGYIPAGSTNDFAQSLGISSEMDEAAADAVNGRLFDCDVGEFNGKPFAYIAAFGVFTEVSYQTDQRLKTVLGHAAYLVNTPKSLKDMPSYRMEVEVNGETIYGDFVYGMISNATSVAGMKNLTGGTVALDDGLFEVTLVKTPQNPYMLGDILTNLLSSNDSDTPYIYSCKTDHIEVYCDEEVPWTLDGEFGDNHSYVKIQNLHHAITFVVPEVSS
ncbi:MAG: diacylglycerol kinase family lipid kinase [Lachnospiraceae bacterium]|nr:diacylglycerol kinase family lipid kinase [Lachnospiraceae bacterium]